MSNSDALNLLREHTQRIRGLAKDTPIASVMRYAGLAAQEMIESHNRRGEYFGGDYADRPYSTRDLPLFFFGKFHVPRTPDGTYTVNSQKTNVYGVQIEQDDVYWRSTTFGRKRAYLKGGYAKWLQYTRPGKSLTRVNHQYTGMMLRNLNQDVMTTPTRGTVTIYVRSPHDRKAFYTHKRRNWMGLTRREADILSQRVAQRYGAEVFDSL